MDDWKCGICKVWNSRAYGRCAACDSARSQPPESSSDIVLIEVRDTKSKDERKLQSDTGNHLYPSQDHQYHAQESTCTLEDSRHTTTKIRANRLQNEAIIERFRAKPLDVYRDLEDRARKNPNFEFPELGDLFDNMLRLLSTLQQRVCCGERMKNKLLDSWTQESLRKEVLGKVPVELAHEITELRRARYPYRDSIRFCLKFSKIMEYIVYRARTEWELKGYGIIADNPEIKNPILKNVSEKTLENDSGQKIIVRYYPYSDIETAVEAAIQKRQRDVDSRFKRGKIRLFGAGFSCFPPEVSLEDIYALASGFLQWPHDAGHAKNTKTLPGILNDPELIVVPTFNYLGSAFFSRVRGVPMCVIGMIDTEFIPADGICMSPLTFFDHDMFHVLGYPGNYETAQLGHTIKYRLQAMRDNDIAKDGVLETWDRNTAAIEKWIDQIGDKATRHALNILVFALLHEPVPISLRRDHKILDGPALPEPLSMFARLANREFVSKVLARVDLGDFDKPGPKTRKYLAEKAAREVLKIILSLEEDAAKGQHGYALNTGGDLVSLPKPDARDDP